MIDLLKECFIQNTKSIISQRLTGKWHIYSFCRLALRRWHGDLSIFSFPLKKNTKEKKTDLVVAIQTDDQSIAAVQELVV